jgi:hypothetical protein
MKKTILLLLTIMIYGFGQSQAQDNLLMNGDFENGRTSWTETAGDISNDGSNSFFYANVEQAGEPSAVNLSQILTIEQGKTYALKFDASTAAGSTRSIWAGIGLNEDPWTSSKQKVNLTDQTQTFTIILTSAAFGSQNSRVLFDMGEEVGFVVLDNVSLEVKENLLINGDFQTGRTSWNDGAGDVIEEGGADNRYGLYRGLKSYFKTIASCYSFTREEFHEMWFMNVCGNILLQKHYDTFKDVLTPAEFCRMCYGVIRDCIPGFDEVHENIIDILNPDTPPRGLKRIIGDKSRLECIMELTQDDNEIILLNELFVRAFAQPTQTKELELATA